LPARPRTHAPGPPQVVKAGKGDPASGQKRLSVSLSRLSTAIAGGIQASVGARGGPGCSKDGSGAPQDRPSRRASVGGLAGPPRGGPATAPPMGADAVVDVAPAPGMAPEPPLVQGGMRVSAAGGGAPPPPLVPASALPAASSAAASGPCLWALEELSVPVRCHRVEKLGKVGGKGDGG
jgi:hypothetical protein